MSGHSMIFILTLQYIKINKLEFTIMGDMFYRSGDGTQCRSMYTFLEQLFEGE